MLLVLGRQCTEQEASVGAVLLVCFVAVIKILNVVLSYLPTGKRWEGREYMNVLKKQGNQYAFEESPWGISSKHIIFTFEIVSK
jgi:hypothetical protein